MAHLWTRSDAGNGEWTVVALAGDGVDLTVGDSGVSPSATVILRRVGGAAQDAWALLAAREARVRVNGVPVQLGIIVLADRDEIRWPPDCTRFFSTEQQPTVVPYPADAGRGFCPRCKQAIPAGEAAVRCPGCGLWHHASDALPCWTYGEHCAACAEPTALDAGFRWTPEELW